MTTDLLNVLFPAKLGRLNYLLRLLLTLGLTWSTLSPAEIELVINHPEQLELSTPKVLVLVFIALYQAVYVAVPRLVDARLRPWLVILLFIPFVSALLACLLALMPTRYAEEEPATEENSE